MNILPRCAQSARRLAIVLATIVCVVEASGCAMLERWESDVPDVKPLRKERKSEIVKSFEKGRDQAEFQAIRSYWQNGQQRQAMERLELLVKRNPHHAAGQALYLEALLVNDQLEKAVAAADRTGELQDATVWHARGLVYDAVGRTDEALECLERAVEREPKNETYLASLEGVRESVPQEPAGVEVPLVAEKPSKHVEPVMPRKSAAAPALLPPKVQASAKPVVVRAPEAVLLESEICLALGRTQEARKRLERGTFAAPLQSQAEELAQRIDAAEQPQLASHEEPVAEHPAAATQDAAVVLLSDAVDPLSSQVVRASSRVSTSVDRSQTKPVQLLPSTSSPPVRSAQEYLDRAETALQQGHLETARRYLTQACDTAPQDVTLVVSTAAAPLRHEEWELAIELATDGLERFSGSAALYRIVGMAEYRLNRHLAAKNALDRAIDLDKNDALAYFLMGCTLSKLRQHDEAQMYFRQAETLDGRYSRNQLAR